MGSSLSPNMSTNLKSRSELNKLPENKPHQNSIKTQTHQNNPTKTIPNSLSRALHLTDHQLIFEKDNPQTQILQQLNSVQSNQIAQFFEATPKKSYKNSNQLPYQKHLYFESALQNAEQNLKFYSVSVPFSVICLVLSKKIINAIHQTHSQFFKKYQNDTNSFKLFQNGCYGHIFTPNYGIFINSTYFYQGHFKQNQNGQFIPSDAGTYISESGKYVGEFQQGKPYGKGKYYQFPLQNQNQTTEKTTQTPRSQKFVLSNQILKKIVPCKIIEGEWKNGELLSGVVQTSESRYQGSLKNGKPQGLGQLDLKKLKTTYHGNFKEGFFDGQLCRYETPTFLYRGDFRRGKKEGLGILTKKIQVKKKSSPRTKYFGEQRYEGIWKNDLLVHEQYVGDRKK